MSECSDRILQALKQADLSYGELAKLTGISKSALQRYMQQVKQKKFLLIV